jgi:hypothetical protein
MSDIKKFAKYSTEDDEQTRLGVLADAFLRGSSGVVHLHEVAGSNYSGLLCAQHANQNASVVVESVRGVLSNVLTEQGIIDFSAGTVTTVDWGTSGPPSAYPRALSAYIDQLQSVNQGLETRVDLLERELAEFRLYLPTIKKLTYEYSSAAERVSACVSRIGRKYDPAEAWKIATEKDVLKGPVTDEDYSEIL